MHFSEVNLMRMENRFDLDISNLNPGIILCSNAK